LIINKLEFSSSPYQPFSLWLFRAGAYIRPLLILPTNRCFKDIIPMFFINSGRIYSPENPKAEIAAALLSDFLL
jgi:hypothetical protein